MFGYRHIYHAGNFADVFKHVVLVELLKTLRQKPSAFCVLDTHAGIGMYPLNSMEARKTDEFQTGIGRVWFDAPSALHDYLMQVRQVNSDGQLNQYPGSPNLIRGLLREQDKLMACELNAVDNSRLKQQFRRDKQVAIHLRDGFEAIKALTPPPEKRGLILIDPPYEDKNDYKNIVEAVKGLQQRWASGMCAIWYPLLDQQRHVAFLNQIKKLAIPNTLNMMLQLNLLDIPMGMGGCGVVLINAPWQFDLWAKATLPVLADALKREMSPILNVNWLTSRS